MPVMTFLHTCGIATTVVKLVGEVLRYVFVIIKYVNVSASHVCALFFSCRAQWHGD